MTARERLLRLRISVMATLLTRALLAGAAVACAGLAASRALGAPALAEMLAWLAGAGVAGALALRGRAARHMESVALWVEERQPSLRYALVAASEGDRGAPLEAAALAVPWWRDAHVALLRALLIPALAAAGALALLRVAPVLVHADAPYAASGIGGGVRRVAARDVLASVRVVVAPPAYSRRATTSTDDPTSVEALVGSAVTVSGEGDASMVKAAVDSTPRGVARHGERWSVTVVMPDRAALMHLRSSQGRERLLVLVPVTDAPPVVTLLLPARDSIVSSATGTLRLRAGLRDDIELRDGQFEVIVSSGAEENFTFRSAVLGRRAFSSTLGVLEVRLSLDSLALKPGDVVQLRAVGRDGNTVSGPGLGSSETRAIRVARAGENDSVSVDAAPPPETEGQALSQRMLVTLAEALVRRKPSLARATLLDESRRLAGDQAKLRKRVGDIIFQRTGADPLSEEVSDEPLPPGKVTPEELLKRADEATGRSAGSPMDVEGDETPILSINKPLLEAFNAMWDAGRSLEQGEPAQALPFMRRALAAIERARQAERIYLRGKPSAEIVDVGRARLAGKDKGRSAELEAIPPADVVARRRGESFARATALLASDPAAAADTLLVLRVGALGDAPALATALDDAARAARRGDGRAAGEAWLRVRRLIAGVPVRRDALPEWSGAR